MYVREFNAAGIEAFREYLVEGRRNPTTPVLRRLLEDDELTVLVTPQLRVEPQLFESRGTAAKHLAEVLAPISDHDLAGNAGLWTWLTLFFFDEICPTKKGERIIRNDYTYIFEPKNSRHFYRHLLFIAWRVLRVAPTHNRLFLRGSLASLDKFTSEVMKRLFLTRIRCVFEVLDRLYWDEEKGRPRPGVVSPGRVRPGDLMHRFPLRIRQLEKTYDLLSLNADQLIELLGDEFAFQSA